MSSIIKYNLINFLVVKNLKIKGGGNVLLCMKYIPLGLQCSVPDGIKQASFRVCSYPFDWLWAPSQTTYNILKILLHEGIEKAVETMTTDWSYYHYLGNEHYISVKEITESQMNAKTGLGNTHYVINEEYKQKLHKRLQRLLCDIQDKKEPLVFLYADAANPDLNYYLDNVEYGVDATDSLLSIYELLKPIHPLIQIVYFCWNERNREQNDKIQYITFEFQHHWTGVANIIKTYLLETKQPCIEFLHPLFDSKFLDETVECGIHTKQSV